MLHWISFSTVYLQKEEASHWSRDASSKWDMQTLVTLSVFNRSVEQDTCFCKKTNNPKKNLALKIVS